MEIANLALPKDIKAFENMTAISLRIARKLNRTLMKYGIKIKSDIIKQKIKEESKYYDSSDEYSDECSHCHGSGVKKTATFPRVPSPRVNAPAGDDMINDQSVTPNSITPHSITPDHSLIRKNYEESSSSSEDDDSEDDDSDGNGESLYKPQKMLKIK